MAADYAVRRATMMRVLRDAGFDAVAPEGAYYVMADVTPLGFDDDTEAAMHLVRERGVASVPGSSFFSDPALGRHLLRFAFCKRLETLEEAGRRLARGSIRSVRRTCRRGRRSRGCVPRAPIVRGATAPGSRRDR